MLTGDETTLGLAQRMLLVLTQIAPWVSALARPPTAPGAVLDHGDKLAKSVAQQDISTGGTGGNNTNDVWFVHIPKDAGSTIEGVGLSFGIRWGKWWGWDDFLLKTVPASRDWDRPCSNWHIPPAAYQKAIDQSPYAPLDTFCVVRNPFVRAMSAAIWEVENVFDTRPSDYCTATYLNELLAGKLNDMAGWLHSFSSWDGALPKYSAQVEWDCHLLPMSAYTNGPNVAECGTVLHMENLDAEWAAARMDVRTGIPAAQFSETKSNEAGCSLPASALNATLREQISSGYAVDFQRFGYDAQILPDDALAHTQTLLARGDAKRRGRGQDPSTVSGRGRRGDGAGPMELRPRRWQSLYETDLISG